MHHPKRQIDARLHGFGCLWHLMQPVMQQQQTTVSQVEMNRLLTRWMFRFEAKSTGRPSNHVMLYIFAIVVLLIILRFLNL